MAVRRVLSALLLLFLCEDSGTIYSQWLSPFGWVFYIIYSVPPYKVRILDHILIVCLVVALGSTEGKGPRVPPMRKALMLALTTVGLGFVMGIVRGGDARAASWQTYLMMSCLLYTFCIAAAFKTPQHFVTLGKVVLIGAGYRALMCWLFHWLYIANLRIPTPEYVTSHDDSVLWTVAILILLMRMLDSKRVGEKVLSFLFILFIGGAVQFNGRRLAWISIVMGLVVLYALLRRGSRPRRTLRRVSYAVVPLLAIYAAVGWGSTAPIFKPLQTFASVSTVEDASTKARNVENLGLVATASTNWLLGAGWGHKYIEISNKYSIASAFELWPYIPHNSILGLLAYSGALGFFGFWLPFPTAMFLNARVAKLATSPLVANIAVITGAQMIVCANQMYGDMGIFSPKTMYFLGTSYAFALRMPILSGVWNNVTTRRARPKQGEASPAPQPRVASAARENPWPR